MGFRIGEGGTISSVAGPAASHSKHSDAHAINSSNAQRLSPAFLLCGTVLSFIGTILPAWGYHLKEDLGQAGEYFLSLNVGFWLAQAFGRPLFRRKGIKFTLTLANVAACVGFLFLAFLPAGSINWRLWGVLWLGMSAGLLHICMSSMLADSNMPAHRAWAWLGLGCALTALLVAGSFYAYSVPVILMLFAIVPAVYAGYCCRGAFQRQVVRLPNPLSQVFRPLNHPGAVLFSLVLFVQFGNEWSIGGWLSLFLIRRLGMSPTEALLLLAVYWLVLMLGRAGFEYIYRRVSPGLTLGSSTLASLLGMIVLASTNNRFGAVMGILFVAAGFAAIYQFAGERMALRFAADHADLYDTVFLVGIAGGLLAPWLIGYLADAWGVAVVMLVPMIGTATVLLLILLTILEAKLSGTPLGS